MNVINERFGIPLVISRSSRADRRARFRENAEQHGFSFQFFNAIELKPQEPATAESLGLTGLINNGYLGRKFPFHTGLSAGRDSRGVVNGVEKRCRLIGCRLSHLEAMQRGSFVMEDDCLLRADWRVRWNTSVSLMPFFDVFYLSCGLEKGRRVEVNHYFDQLLETYWGNWAYYVTGRGREIKTKYLLNVDTKIHCDTGIRTMGYLREATIIRPKYSCFFHDNPGDSDTQVKEQSL